MQVKDKLTGIMQNKCILQGNRTPIKRIKQTTASIFRVEYIF
jgi:hypothetical protein